MYSLMWLRDCVFMACWGSSLAYLKSAVKLSILTPPPPHGRFCSIFCPLLALSPTNHNLQIRTLPGALLPVLISPSGLRPCPLLSFYVFPLVDKRQQQLVPPFTPMWNACSLGWFGHWYSWSCVFIGFDAAAMSPSLTVCPPPPLPSFFCTLNRICKPFPLTINPFF